VSGSTFRVYCKKGTNTLAESINSKFEPSTGTPSGAALDQGAEVHSRSEPDSVRPGKSPGATNTSASSPYNAAAATQGRAPTVSVVARNPVVQAPHAPPAQSTYPTLGSTAATCTRLPAVRLTLVTCLTAALASWSAAS